MILLDFSQTFHKSLARHLYELKANGMEPIINPDKVRELILSSILSYVTKHKKTYGDLIIVCDDKNFWRKDIFPFYKAKRKEKREESDIDWAVAFKVLNDILEELVTYFPYRVMKIENTEADDIIGVICYTYGKQLGGDPILIISADEDFGALQIFSNVKQYDPIQKKDIVIGNPTAFLKEKIIRGDKGDGIPNFLMPDDTFINGIRQKPIRDIKVLEWLEQDPEEFCDEETINNYRRNERLIDLSFIPDDIKEKVIFNFEQEHNKSRGKIFNYFIKHNLKSLLAQIQEF
jgi:hypothetical protein